MESGLVRPFSTCSLHPSSEMLLLLECFFFFFYPVLGGHLVLFLGVLLPYALKSCLSSSEDAGEEKPAQSLEQGEVVGLLDQVDGFGLCWAVRKNLKRPPVWDYLMVLVVFGEAWHFLNHFAMYWLSTEYWQGRLLGFPVYTSCTKAMQVWKVPCLRCFIDDWNRI